MARVRSEAQRALNAQRKREQYRRRKGGVRVGSGHKAPRPHIDVVRERKELWAQRDPDVLRYRAERARREPQGAA